MATDSLSLKELSYLVHHIFLPPQVPNKDDSNPTYDRVLLQTVRRCLTKFCDYDVPERLRSAVRTASEMVQNMDSVHEAVRDSSASWFAVNEGNLQRAFADLSNEGGSIPLHIAAQNAGLIIYKADSDVNVEIFELSPLNQDVMTTKGRLRRSFPASAVAIPEREWSDIHATLASVLARMSTQPVAGTQPQAKKARKMHDEYRDTTHPKMVTDFLAAILLALGGPAKTSALWKNTREEVRYRSSMLPWRRSPTWLLVRVALQLSLSRYELPDEGFGDLYKGFMVFLLADILSRSKEQLSSDLLWAMSAKVHRRLQKIRCTGPRVSDYAHAALRETRDILDDRWARIQERDAGHVNLIALKHMDFKDDARMNIPELDRRISSMGERTRGEHSVAFRPRDMMTRYSADRLPNLTSSTADSLCFDLLSFETWVADNLDRWLETQVSDPSTCKVLADEIRRYHVKMQHQHSRNPESMSTMVLTIVELWIACDRAAIHACPLLAEYDPGVPAELLQSLLLPLKADMRRLRTAEKYLESRLSGSKVMAPRVFAAFGTNDCFAVKWFQTSQSHHSLKARIESRATDERRNKREELRSKKERYNELMDMHGRTEHGYIDVYMSSSDSYEPQHASNCQKCGYRSKAESIRISIHEWPLPTDTLEAQSTVFELDVPQSFGHWRDVTLFLRLNVLEGRHSAQRKPRSSHTLQGYQGLSRFFVPFSTMQRVYLLSENKPHGVTHRNAKPVSNATGEADICLENALWYAYFDGEDSCFVDDIFNSGKMESDCTYTMPTNSATLQQFLSRPAHSASGPPANTVIATQSDCPGHMPLEEYKALCSIPLGNRLQWQNILVQLHAPYVDFKKIETLFVLLQCISQAGPPCNTMLRESHAFVGGSAFANRFLQGLELQLQSVQANWQCTHAMSGIISLACRLCALTSDTSTKSRCSEFLSKCRHATLDWLSTLQGEASRATEGEARAVYHSKVLLIALICSCSFDVDEDVLREVLSLPENASALLRCSVAIAERQQCVDTGDSLLRLLQRRWQRLVHRSYVKLAEQIVAGGGEELDDAIKLSWPAYNPVTGWSVVSTHKYWLSTDATNVGTDETLRVHFNLLSGELLVNGTPLGRLPAEYEQHETYRELFGKSMIEVMPSALPGMRFSAKSTFHGYTLHFGMASGDGASPEAGILLRASKDDCWYELIPRELFDGHCPTAFVEERVHWYDTIHDTVQFRARANSWHPDTTCWSLVKAGVEGGWQLQSDSQLLVAVNSLTAKLIAKALEPLEDLRRVHCFLHWSSSSLKIELPRLQLEFSVRAGSCRLESRQYRGMFVDENQSVNTLVGLRNKLAMRQDGCIPRRMVLIPDGEVFCKRCDGHVCVSICKDTMTRAYAYNVDTLLGNLQGPGSHESRLLQCYLHALTSFCLPDPLTRRTGTEEALSILNSAAILSFASLSEQTLSLLQSIAGLSPSRMFYPANECVMQVVKWSPTLDFLAQHGSYHTAVRRLYDRHSQMSIFDSQPPAVIPSLELMDASLLGRDDIRTSTFRVAGFGAESFGLHHDVFHHGRDIWQASPAAARTYAVTRFMLRKSSKPCCKMPRDMTAHIWNFLAPSDILGSNEPLPSALGYDARWLKGSCEFISKHWLAIHDAFSRNRQSLDKFGVTMWLATLAFAENPDMPIIYTIASFFTLREMAQVVAPQACIFRLEKGFEATQTGLSPAIRRGSLPYGEQCPEANLTRRRLEDETQVETRRRKAFGKKLRVLVSEIALNFKNQWPCDVPQRPRHEESADWAVYFDMDEVFDALTSKFKSWYDNFCLRNYVSEVESHVSRQTHCPETGCPTVAASIWDSERCRGFVNAEDIFSHSAPTPDRIQPPDLSWLLCLEDPERPRQSRLTELIARLEARAGCRYERQYVEILKSSLRSLQSSGEERTILRKADWLSVALVAFKEHSQTCVDRLYSAMLLATGVLHAAGAQHWPRVSPVFFLQQLSRGRWSSLPEDWKHCLIQYGCALTALQRAERMVEFSGNAAKLVSELQNPGHTNWNPSEYPESLLLEIESGIMIREVQEQIAARMRKPSAGKNEIMQLNMGEGKSSVIVPMVAAALADGARLVRVIVAKPQAKQMFGMMVAKFGGLLDRPVFLMPFSRSLALREGDPEAIQNMCRHWMTTGGVLLVQPEQVLSFKLMAIERIISCKDATTSSMLKVQEFLGRSTRDIVDESDENFSVKFELVYTMGTQRPIDHSPARWTCIHEALEAFRTLVLVTKRKFPESIEMHPGPPGCFPRTRILRDDALEDLLSQVAQHICDNGLTGFPICRQPEPVRRAVYKYIREPRLAQDDIDAVEGEGGFGTDDTNDTLLLLRGLLAGGVLSFVFANKRWRVDYGPDPTRQRPTKLAVPFRAKDIPSPRAEYSHPDVVIVLTSLSYYYCGLSNEELFLVVADLQKSEQADMEFQAWVRDAVNLPPSFQQLVSINLEDRPMCAEKLFPCLSYAKSVIDYYLAHLVFPKEMREFPHKLSASGWDIGESKSHSTTGFSGTNDSRIVLPLSVDQLDLQMHTNALVIQHLLQPENCAVVMQQASERTGSEAERLLAMVTNMEPPVRVILDVGAQFLELDNIGVAQEWLKTLPDDDATQAVVFLDEDDHICVLDRRGYVEVLNTSPFAKQLDVCLVFLDEAHTRGTDLVLPVDYRAAVTLGANLTKDRLVQACMRMRRLGKGQSVVFCVPEEIASKLPTREPDVADVLEWAVMETWQDAARSLPLWAVQGRRHLRNDELWAKARGISGVTMSEADAREFLEPESLSMRERYGPSLVDQSAASTCPDTKHQNIHDPITQRFLDFGQLNQLSSTLREEQERELSPEIERERQVQRAQPARPATHFLHPDVEAFVSTGVFPVDSAAHMPAFEALRTTSAAAYLDVTKCPRSVAVSLDFIRTIQADGDHVSDCFHRSVQWILTGSRSSSRRKIERMMIISPFEAQELTPRINESTHVALHLYAPRPNPGYRALDSLDLYTIPEQSSSVVPRSLRIELNLFSGQLYFASLQECVNVCRFLGMATFESRRDLILQNDTTAAEYASDPEVCHFAASPVKFFQVFMSQVRRNSVDISKTHVGCVLDYKCPTDFLAVVDDRAKSWHK